MEDNLANLVMESNAYEVGKDLAVKTGKYALDLMATSEKLPFACDLFNRTIKENFSIEGFYNPQIVRGFAEGVLESGWPEIAEMSYEYSTLPIPQDMVRKIAEGYVKSVKVDEALRLYAEWDMLSEDNVKQLGYKAVIIGLNCRDNFKYVDDSDPELLERSGKSLAELGNKLIEDPTSFINHIKSSK